LKFTFSRSRTPEYYVNLIESQDFSHSYLEIKIDTEHMSNISK
jgi:hypothetical protein